MKPLNILLGSAVALLLFACTTNKEIYYVSPEFEEDWFTLDNTSLTSDNPYFTATDEGGEVSFKTKGGEVAINVNCPIDWTAEVTTETKDGSDWLNVDVNCESGQLIIVAVQNSETSAKEAVVELMTVVAKTVFSTITVVQNAYGTPEITVEQNVWQAPAVGVLTTEIAVETAFDEWSVETTTCTWLLAEKLDGAVRLTVVPNTENAARTIDVVLISTDGTDSDSDTIVVSQDGAAYISLTSGALTFYETAEAKISSSTVESNFDWDFSYDTSNGWFSISRDGDTLTATVSEANEEEDNREGTVIITAGDGLENMTEVAITVTQLGLQGSSLVLIYTVSAGSEVKLPLSGTVDCTVDWGDGNTTDVTSTFPTHSYEIAGEYFVSIKGTVTELNSNSLTKSYRDLVSGVKQWGDTGLTSLDHAFYYCINLEGSLPADDFGAFSEVTSAYYAFAYCGTVSKYSGGTLNDPATAAGLSGVSEDLFQYAEKCTDFRYVFYSSYNLDNLPSGLFRNCKSASLFNYAFAYDVNVHAVPEGFLSGCPEITTVTRMFYYCGSLTTIPSDMFAYSPEITDVSYCFDHCSSLMEIPGGLFDGLTECIDFQYVFQYCTALKRIPKSLFAYNSKAENLKYVFAYCSEIEEIQDGVLDNITSCTALNGFFYCCEKLKSVPAGMLDDATSVESVASLFYHCYALESVPEGLFDNMTACTDFSHLFQGTGFTSIPGDYFKNCTQATSVTYLFAEIDFETIPEGLLDYFPNVTDLKYIFNGCKSLKEIRSDVFRNCSNVSNFQYAFANCTALTSIPVGLFDSCKDVAETMTYLFNGCTALEEIADDAFAGMTACSSWRYAFKGCTNLKKVGARAFYGNTAVTTIQNMFDDCPALESIGESAFEGCTKLETMTSLFSGCANLKSVGKRAFAECNGTYCSVQKMFENCTSLTDVGEQLFADCADLWYIQYLFDGCSALESVPDSIFEGSKGISNTTYVFRNSGLRTISSKVFENWTNSTSVTYLFSGCTNLTSVPADLFDSMTALKTFSYAFKGCENLECESPYTMIGDVKVHLYERSDYTDYFTKPTSTTQCFNGCTKMTDYGSLPSGWY